MSGSPAYNPDGSPAYSPDGSPAYSPDGSPAYNPDGSPAYNPDGSPAYNPDNIKPNAKIKNLINKNERQLAFTLSGVLPSFANAIRRTILSDIPVIGFITTPFEENRATIIKNTSRFNNEYLKQRLSCIPIYSNSTNLVDENGEKISNTRLVNEFAVELHVKNKTDSVLWVTTHDFRLIDKITKEPVMSKEHNAKIIEWLFPPFIFTTKDTKHYIDVMSLRPFISDSLPGEEVYLTCEFSICSAKKNSCYNVAHMITYQNTIDLNLLTQKTNEMKEVAKTEKKTKTEIDFMVRNFELLEGKRLFIPNSFEFTVETLGFYKNDVLVQYACSILYNLLVELERAIVSRDESIVLIHPNLEITIPNCWDIVLQNEDYTLGTMLNDILYRKYCVKDNESDELPMLNFCGFKKEHPHDTSAIIRIGFADRSHNTLERVNEIFIYAIRAISAEFITIENQMIF